MTKLVIFDLDGTLYRGREAIAGAPEAVARLRNEGIAIRFVTNNSSRTAENVAADLVAKGFYADPCEVMTSGIATARYCNAEGVRSVFVVGEAGLTSTLRTHGVRTEEHQPDGVVVGICRHFDYALLAGAAAMIRAGSRFIATNEDSTYPIEGGIEVPGAGAMVAAVRAASGAEPVVLGKPNPAIILELLESVGALSEETLVVGDRVETDIEAGRRAGCRTHLVLTGVTSEAPSGLSWSHDLSGLPI